MKEQTELFPIEHDDRIQKLTQYLEMQIDIYPFWYPSARQIIEIGDRFCVVGSKPLDIVEKIWQRKYGKSEERIP